MTPTFEGPDGYKLWNAHLSCSKSKEWAEYLLYSDSHISGEILEGLGPFQILNALPDQQRLGFSRAALCLRVCFPDVNWMEIEASPKANKPVDPQQSTDPDAEEEAVAEKANDAYYHGKGYTDEIAALIGLILGVRLKAGPQSRISFGDDDGKGKPIHLNEYNIPLLSPRPSQKPCVPEVYRDTTLVPDTEHVNLLKGYAGIKPKAAIALVRAARLYQEAIWIAENEPSTSWLFLVAAVETGAVFWKKKNKRSRDLFREYYPELTDQILSKGDDKLLGQVANEFAGNVKVKDKFIGFSINFLPEAPPKRAKFGLQEWETTAIKKTLEIIYTYRSNALHSGIPFPFFMNQAPFNFDGHLTESFSGLSGRSMGGEWQAEHMPLLLNTYAYMVRKTLLKWWESLISKK